MQEVRHPNKLKKLLATAGLTQREAAHESGIPEGTLRHYIAGEQVIPRRDRVKLAQVIGCDVQDLAPQYDRDVSATEGGIITSIREKWGPKYTMTDSTAKGPSRFEERDGCFSFGRLKTTWRFVDGDGIGMYLPRHIHSHYIPFAEELPEELHAKRKRILQEQEQKREQGKPFLWNGEIYSLQHLISPSRMQTPWHQTLYFQTLVLYTCFNILAVFLYLYCRILAHTISKRRPHELRSNAIERCLSGDNASYQQAKSAARKHQRPG